MTLSEPFLSAGCMQYSIISDRLLYTYTLTAESTGQQFCWEPSNTRIFGCQLSILGANVSFLFLTDFVGVLAFFSFLFDPFGHI